MYPSLSPGLAEEKTALNFVLGWVRSGHNNIKLNPVFRGMVRSHKL
jgi:hypothetical protein